MGILDKAKRWPGGRAYSWRGWTLYPPATAGDPWCASYRPLWTLYTCATRIGYGATPEEAMARAREPRGMVGTVSVRRVAAGLVGRACATVVQLLRKVEDLRRPACYGVTGGVGYQVELYRSRRDASLRARSLRALGYPVRVAPDGPVFRLTAWARLYGEGIPLPSRIIRP